MMGALQEQKPNTTVSYNPNEAHIVYASDDGFAEILGVSMVSLYENSKDMEFIAVYVLDFRHYRYQQEEIGIYM